VIVYFAILFVWSVWAAISEGSTVGAALMNAARLLPVALVATGLLTSYAWLVHRTTVYTLTNRRLVMRFGVALPVTLNIPFAIVGIAGVKIYGDKTGDMPLALSGADRVSYFALWPHVRPWWTAKPQPMLRSVAQVEQVSATLRDALRLAARSRAIAGARVEEQARHQSLDASEAEPQVA